MAIVTPTCPIAGMQLKDWQTENPQLFLGLQLSSAPDIDAACPTADLPPHLFKLEPIISWSDPVLPSGLSS